MKKLILCLAAFGLLACNGASDKGYTVNVSFNGEVSELASDTLILTNRAKGDNLITSTAVLENGKAVFKGALGTPQYFYLQAGSSAPLTSLFLENADFDVTVTVENGKPAATVRGGAIHTTIDSLKQAAADILAAADVSSLRQLIASAKTQEVKDSLIQVLNDANQRAAQVEADYIQAHPTSHFALHKLASELQTYGMDLDSARKLLSAFQVLPEFQNNTTLSKALSTVDALEALTPGNQAPEFVQNDTQGNPVKFSDVYKQNKVTMVDFWASWCGPCRRFNPTLVKIYNQYKDKGFGIIGVSLDTDKDAWLKAIEDDKLTWQHVSDLGGWNNAVSVQYLVRYIPQNIFVDQEGKIIKRQASEEEIAEVLEQYLK